MKREAGTRSWTWVRPAPPTGNGRPPEADSTSQVTVEVPTGATLLPGALYVSEARWKSSPAVRARKPRPQYWLGLTLRNSGAVGDSPDGRRRQDRRVRRAVWCAPPCGLLVLRRRASGLEAKR